MISPIDTKIIGKKIIHFESVNSTNLFAKKLIKDGVEEGTIVVADVQSSGRGRKDRTWSSPKGGLWFSVILFPKMPPENGMLITMAISISIVEGIKEITNLDSVIKWPNDVLIDGKKVCGVLTEIQPGKSNVDYAIVGIGINVNNELEKELDDVAISLNQLTGEDIPNTKLLENILKKFDFYYNKLSLSDFNLIKDKWLLYSNIIDRKVKVKDGDKIATGNVIDIGENGSLILKTETGKVNIFSGDIEYL